MDADKTERDVEERIWREAEQTRRNDQERHRRESDARERARRDALMRIIEAEARVEQEAERLMDVARLEYEACTVVRGSSRPVGALVALALSALLALVGFGTWLMHAEDVEAARQAALAAQQAQAERASMMAEREAARTRFEGQLLHLRGRLAKSAAPNNQ